MATRSRCVASVTFLVTVVVVAIVQAADITQVAVRQYDCRTIYHSPQTPGYTEGSVVVLDDGALLRGLGAVVDVLRCAPDGLPATLHR